MDACCRVRTDGIDIIVRLTPKSSAERVDGVETSADGRSHLKARVRAVPEKGAANAALERLVADWLGVPRSSVAISSGATARLKTVRVAGDPKDLAALVGRLTATGT